MVSPVSLGTGFTLQKLALGFRFAGRSEHADPIHRHAEKCKLERRFGGTAPGN